MKQKYRYKFERIGESWIFGVATAKAEAEYRRVVHEHARDGWRLVQVFAPSFGAFGAAKYIELIFEKELE